MYISMVCPWVCVCAYGVCACVQLCAFELIFASVCEYTSVLEWWPYYVFDMWILFQRWMSMIMACASRTIVFLTYAFVPPHTHHTHMRTHTRTHVIHHTYTHNTRMLHMHTHTHSRMSEEWTNNQHSLPTCLQHRSNWFPLPSSLNIVLSIPDDGVPMNCFLNFCVRSCLFSRVYCLPRLRWEWVTIATLANPQLILRRTGFGSDAIWWWQRW